MLAVALIEHPEQGELELAAAIPLLAILVNDPDREVLEAAIWAFHHTDNFEDGAILAVNLAGDADTVGAVYGQLAGAYYGEMQINPEWIRELAKFHIFYLYADKLLRFGVCDMLGDSKFDWDND